MTKTFLTCEQLERLTTPRLLAYKNSILKAHEHKDWDGDILLTTVNGSYPKDSPEWQAQYQLLKEILATRKHVERNADGKNRESRKDNSLRNRRRRSRRY